MKFKEFCMKRAISGNLSAVQPDEIPEKYVKPTKALIDIMKYKMAVLDKINVAFIETLFDDDYEGILETKLTDGEVPNGIIHTLSEGLYGKIPSELNDEESSIIKVLSVYICIQN